ncbi:MAG: 4Fe-4S dicluster domain-containing protein [Anaerolineae bacterium]|nr:MAG: 4Fe-4S dicluster domain-containing protein [Anaerolineae bacterium]
MSNGTSVHPDTLASAPTGAPGSFLDEVLAATPGDSRLDMCIQCGTCGGSCPSASDMDHTPRQLFAMIRADMREAVLRSSTPWYCVSCYYCTVRCPQEVHITDVMYTLKSMAIRAKLYDEAIAPDFSQTFIDYIENYGRSFEFGLATRHNLKHRLRQAPSMIPMGLGMFTKGRMDLTPQRIEGIDQLRSILACAIELEAVG